MALRSFRLLGVASGLLALSLSTTTKPWASAFVTPVKRSSVGARMGLPQKQLASFPLAMASKKTQTLVCPDECLTEDGDEYEYDSIRTSVSTENDNSEALSVVVAATSTTIMGLAALSEAANAVSSIAMPKELTQSFDPNSFVPVCAASDGFYRVLQSTAQTVVGRENFVEYGPLIASGLLRVRLELCVVESFFNEAVGPFISQNGLSWVLPLHETVETFLAGTVFALATTFILVGSTKLLTVIFTYADFFVGGPLRLFGGFFFDRARGKPVILDVGLGPFKTRVIGPKDDGEGDAKKSDFDYSVDFNSVNSAELPVVIASGGVKFVGQSIGFLREVLDAIDLFVGKSLILWVTAYIGIKFLHFKVFPDFP
ncbi:unnamed protein product [Pseudo-nitzschia multistriata]|uniref:Plastid lipid-associated protein/fibrillin conserved domain-containing protein n=1 Tax=Pseudo-nitzschia multistriata TaxID=183589 RepID=A0A448YUJ1_9STRA|nr:unnamed protein product [Pseudo-nitzschia multistriata]